MCRPRDELRKGDLAAAHHSASQVSRKRPRQAYSSISFPEISSFSLFFPSNRRLSADHVQESVKPFGQIRLILFPTDTHLALLSGRSIRPFDQRTTTRRPCGPSKSHFVRDNRVQVALQACFFGSVS